MELDDKIGHRQRLKEKYYASGISSLHDYEILELLITYAVPRRDCKPIAKDIIKRYGSISNFFDNLDKKETQEINGIKKNGYILFSLINDIKKIYAKEKLYDQRNISSTDELMDYLKEDIGKNKNEVFKVLFLDSKNTLLSDETLFQGTLNKSHIYLREIVKRIMELNAASIIIVHNHPSGNLKPSREDIRLTERIKKHLNEIDVRLLDHIIITKNSFYSFLENKLMP